MHEEALQQIERIIEYSFSNRDLLEKAITHSSSVDDRLLSNERMEFFGDSVLALVICQKLFERFPSSLEGDLTKLKSMLVSRKTCAKICKELGLEKFLKLGKGTSDNRALSGSLAAGLLETIIAALYIDGGMEVARNFILKHFTPILDQSNSEHEHGNYKSLLQQYAQQKFSILPNYELLDEKGPDHNKCFETVAVIKEQYFQSAWGINKKEAEQKAAFNALIELGVLEDDLNESNTD